MTRTDPYTRLVEAIADARAAAAAAAVIGSFDSVGEKLQRSLEMKARLEAEKARTEAAVARKLKDILAHADTLAEGKIPKRLVEADAIISPTGRKVWLSDVHRAANQDYNRVLQDHAQGEASLVQADAARLVLSATREAMHLLGRPIEQHEKQHKARTAFKAFDQDDYPSLPVRRAIVLMALADHSASAEYLESRSYDPVLDRDGRIACLLDAWSDDGGRRAEVMRIAADILAHDAPEYRVELAGPRPADPAVPAAVSIGDRARACARGVA